MAMTDNLTAAVDEVKAYNEKLERVRSTYNALSPEKKQKYAHEMQARLAQEAGSYINSYNYLENSFRDQYGKQGYRSADEADKYAARLRQMSSRVSQRARRYADIMDIYGADMDEDFRTQFNELLDGTRTGMYQLNNAARDNAKYYGQFADENAYNLYLDYQAHPEKYRESDEPVYYDNLGREVDVEKDPKWKAEYDYNAQVAEVERLKQEKRDYELDYQEWQRSFSAESRKYGSDPETRASNPEYQQFAAEWDAEDARRQAEYDDYDARIAEAEARAKELEKEYDEAWAPYKDARTGLKKAWGGEVAKTFLLPFGGFWQNPKLKQAWDMGKYAVGAIDKDDVKETWEYASPAVQEAAKAYAEVGGDPNATVIGAGVGHYAAPFVETGRVFGELIAPEHDFSGWVETADKLQDTSDAWLADQTAGRNGAGTFIANIGDQAVPLAIETGLSSIPYVGKTLGTISFLGRSFGSGAMEARRAGASLEGQVAYGTLSAAIEAVTEAAFGTLGKGFFGTAATDRITNHFVGKLFKTKAGQNIAKVLVAAFGEGLEEVMSDVLYPAAKSVYNGKTIEENYKEAFRDENGALDFSDTLYSFAVGATLGGLGGGATAVKEMTVGLDPETRYFIEAGASGVSFKEAHAEWLKSGLDNAKALGSGETYNKAIEYEERLNQGKRVSEKKIEKLNARAVKELSNADIANTSEAVQKRLAELGVSDPNLAQAITAVALEREAARVGAKGVGSTAEQRKMVANSKIAQRVLSEMDVENMRREAEAEYALTRANSEGKATKDDYDRIMPQFFRTNEWVKNMEPNKLLAADVYGEKSGTITVSSEEKLDKIKVGNKELYVVGVEDGKIKLKQGAKGKAYKTIAVDDIEGISDSYRMLLTAAAARKSGSAMLKAYRPGQDLVSFVRAWDLAEQVYGKLTNITFAQARKAFNLRALSDVQLQAALDVGRAAAPKTSNKVTKKEVSGELTFWEGGEIEGSDYDATNEAEARKLLGDDEVDFVKNTLSKVADVTLVKSKADENGNFTGAQGIFYENGHIYIDVNAGLDSADIGQRTIILTAAHEMTHYIRSYNEAAYEALRDFIVAELTAKGQNIEDLMLEKQARSSKELSDDAALEEVIADSCEMMFTDVSKVKAFANAHEAEARMIWKWLDKFLSNMKERFSGLKAAHREAAAMMDKIDEMRKIWFKALGEIQTGESNATIETATEPADLVHSDTNSLGFTTAVTDETGHATFSLRTYEQSGKKNLDAFLAKQVGKKALTPKEADQMRAQLDELYKVCKTYDNGKYAPFSAWSNAEVVTVNGRPVFSVVKKNGEYKLNLDFSLVCKKRRTLDAVFNEMIRRGIMNRAFGEQGYLEMRPETIAEINNIIRAHGFETACALCFVDSKRYRQAMIADAFADMYNEQVRSLVEGTDMQPTYFNYGGDRGLFNEVKTRTDLSTVKDSDLNWSKVNEILADKSLKGKVVYKIAESLKKNPKNRKLASRGDFMSTAGFDALNAENPELLSLYNSKKGAGGPKAAQSDVQYLNEVIQQGKFSVKAAYAVGGVRIQSFSDYVGRLVFDYVQMVADLSAKKLPAHSYTKEFMFAQQFGLTGIKINMSLVPAVVDGGVAPGLDENGNYAWKDGQSFGSTVYDNKGKRMTAQEGFELAIKIQNAEGYSRNCGTIAVGVSDEHILKMLSDPNIRMIIPYRKSGLNHLVAAMNQIDKYTDYTNYQNTMMQNERGEWVKIPAKQEFNWNETLQKMEKQGKGAKEAAQAYIEWCEKNNYRPKFDRDGMEFSKHENYYKLLEDFSAYDSDGKPAPLGAVQMNFPTEASEFGSMQDLIEAGLEEDAMLQAKQEGGVDDIVDEIQSVLPEWEAAHPEGKKAKHADRDLPFSKNATDAERYRYLRGISISPAVYQKGLLDIQVQDLPGKTLEEKFENLKQSKMPVIKKALKNLADKLGIPNETFRAEAIDIGFGYTKNAVSESVQYQDRDRLLALAKALTVFDQLAKTAVPLNIRDDVYGDVLYKADASHTEAWYSCLSAYLEGNKIVPVKIDIDERKGEENRAHLVIVFSEFEAINNESQGKNYAPASSVDRKRSALDETPPQLTISVAEVLRNVKSNEYELLKDIPEGFLNDEQIQGQAIAKELFDLHILDKISQRAEANKIDRPFLQNAYESAIATGDRTSEEALKSFADPAYRSKASLRDTEAVRRQQAKDKARLDALRAEKNAKIERVRKEEVAKRREAVAKEKAAKWKKVEETKEHYRDMMGRDRARRSDTKIRGEIKDLHKELTNMLLKPGENRYVPKSLVKATAEILDAVDITTGKPTKASEAFAALRSKYDALKTDEHYSAAYDETVSGMLQKLAETVGDGNIYDLTGNDLEAVYTTLKSMKHIIQTANKLVGAEIEKAASEVALQMISETRSAKEMKTWPQRFYSLAVTNPRVMFNVLGNYRKNSAWSQMYDMLNKGQLTQTQTLMEGGQIFRGLIDDKRVESLHKHGQKDLVDIGLTDSSGNSVKVTRGMMLSIYMHLLNEQNAKHIMYGGLTVPRFNEYYGNLFKAANMKEAYKGVTVRAGSFSEEMVEINRQLREAETQEEIDALNERLDELQADAEAYLDNIRTRIEKELNDYDREWIKAAQSFFDDYSKRKLNEVTEMVYGFQKAQVDNYFPIHTDPDYRTANFESIARDMSLENAGFMKERINGSNPILLEDITDVLNNQLRRTAQYVGLMPAIRNFNKVYGKSTAGYGDSVQKAVGEKFHSTGAKAIENLIADLNGARYKDPTVFDSIRGNVAAANLTINPRVTLAQVASYPTAAAEIGYAPLIKAIKDVTRNPVFNAQAAEEVAKWTPLWWYRMQGYSNAELGDIKSNGQFMKKVMDKTKWLTGWIQFADGLTTGALWQASKYYVDENFSSLEKGSDEYMMKVAEVYNKVIERTQPDYTTMQRPDLLRSPNSTVKMLTMFMTQRLQNYSLLYDSAAQYASYKRDYKKGINGVTAADVKSAGTKLAWTVSSQLIAAATIVTFKLLADALLHNMNAYRDDDEELTGESVSKQLLLNWLESLASNVVAGSEIFSLLSTAFTHERYYGVSLNGISAITDTASDVQKLLDKTLSGNGEASRKAALSLAQDLSQILGIPTRNAIKIVDAVKYHYEDAKNGQLGSFEAGVERSKSTNAKLLYRALETGDTQRVTYLKGQYANEKEYRSAVKGYVKTLFVDEHGITRQKAKDALVKYVGMTPKEAEKTSLEWQMEADTGIAYGNLRDEYVSGRVSAANAARYIVKYGGQNEAEAEAKVREWQCEKDTGIAYSDIDTEVKTGRLEPEKAIAMLEKYGGKDEDKATKTVEGWRIEHEYGISPDDLEEEYLAGNVSEDEALDILQRYKFYGKEDAAERAAEEIEKYDFIAGNPGVEDITVTQVRQYKASGLENFVSPVDYFEALKVTNTFKGLDEDNDGRTDSYSVAMQKMRYIDEMDLTPEQKTALARALGISEKTIKRRAPWR